MSILQMQRTDGARLLKIVVIGTGISRLPAVWLLSQRLESTAFEAVNRIGGHSNTIRFDSEEGPVAVDTGFIAYNEVTYPPRPEYCYEQA